MRSFIAVVTFSVLANSSHVLTARADDVDGKMEKLAASYIDEMTALLPVEATELGDHRFDSELNKISKESRRHQVEFCRKYLKELKVIDRDELSQQNQIDHELLEHDLQKTIWQIEVLREWEWNPLVYTGLIGSSIYSLMSREFAPLDQRLKSAAARLKQFPRILRQARATLVPKLVPPIHAETAIAQNRGVLNILENMVKPHLPKLDAEQQKKVRAAIKVAEEAIDEHQTWLEKTLAPQAAGNFRVGPKLYDEKLRFTMQSGLSRDQIRARAESELRRVRAEMYDISKSVYLKKYPLTEFPEESSKPYQQAIIRACLELAYAEIPARDEVVATAEESMKLTTEFVRSKDLVTIPDDPLEIIIMPEFQRGVSVAYCDSPGPLDVGQKTFYAVAPLPDDWTDQQCASFSESTTRCPFTI